MQGGKPDLLGLLKVSVSTCPLIKPASRQLHFGQNNSTKQSHCVIQAVSVGFSRRTAVTVPLA